MIPLAVTTMVYDDAIYLDVWLRYWEQRLPRNNLYVFIHDNYEHYEAKLTGCNTLRIARPEMHPEFERDRWRMLSNFCSGLTYMFDRVIYTDVDEILVLAPNKGDDVVAHILDLDSPLVCPFGLEVVQNTSVEKQPYTPHLPVLSQRQFVAPHGMYCKPCVISEPIFWGSGGHFCDRDDAFLSDDLFLFHLRLFDENTYIQRSKKRRLMIRDKNTGKTMRGVGGPSWRSSENELSNFEEAANPQLVRIEFPEVRATWRNSAKFDDYRGVWQRKGPLTRKLFQIPESFKTVF